MPAERRFRFLRGVQVEITNATAEYDEAREGLGEEFACAIERAMEHIADGPQRWPRLDGRHHRFVLRRFPFNVVYRYNETEIIVVAVSHQRRHPDYWRGR